MATRGTDLETRRLTPADAPDLAALAARLGGPETTAQWLRFLSRPDAVGIAVVTERSIVGYAAGEVRGGFGLPAPAAWIEAFGIDLSWRGHGVGRVLLQELLGRFSAAGAVHVYTVVPVHDRSLVPFFRQAGLRDEPLACLGCDL